MKTLERPTQAKNQKVRRIGQKVGNVMAWMLAINILIINAICMSMFHSQMSGQLRTECLSATNVLEYAMRTDPTMEMGQLIAGLKNEMGCEFAIFNGDTEIYSTMTYNGQSAVGTKMQDKIKTAVLQRGEHFVGQVTLGGTKYIASYKPVRGTDGQIAGAVFSGVSTSEAFRNIYIAILCSIVVGIVLIVVAILAMAAYLRRTVSEPMAKITGIAEAMEQGDMGIKSGRSMSIDLHSNDEIGHLARIFEGTIARLGSYISEISVILEGMSNGCLTAYPTQDYVGDFVTIKTSMEDINRKMHHTMSEIVESAKQVASGSDQMSSGAQALSQGAVEQASTVESLENTMHEISGRVADNANSAQVVRQKVSDMGTQLEESNEKMNEMIRAMEEINTSSNEISKIVKTIEDIAFQTNILALNAAVEAARAGDAGKGFAVVADQVRNLAGQSAEASQSTTVLIERSIKAVSEGTKIANLTAGQLSGVVTSAGEIINSVNDIANASSTQAESVAEVQRQISQITAVVQTNSATAEESAATSEELSAQAGIMKQLTDIFKL